MTAIHTPREYITRAMTTSSSSTAFNSGTALGPTATEPVTVDGDYAVFLSGHNHTKLYFFGTDAENEDGHVKVWIHSPITAQGLTHVWVREYVGTFVVTQGGDDECQGVAGGAIGTGENFCDTIVASGNYNTTVVAQIYSPANDSPGYILLDTMGGQKVEVEFDKDAGGTESATLNVAYRKL